MKYCSHECTNCGETWNCSYPYRSEFQFFETVVNNGSYCNSFCPSCQKDERAELDLLFEETSETGYINTFVNQIKGST